MTHVRLAASGDRDAIRGVYLRAFPDNEKQLVATLADELLGERTVPETISLVADIDGVTAAHVAFSPVAIPGDRHWQGFILAPLGVLPEYQGRGLGRQLIECGLRRLSKTGVDAVFVYGDPAYYGRFGFSTDTASGFAPPYELKFPFGWQALVLHERLPVNPAAEITCVAALRDPALW